MDGTPRSARETTEPRGRRSVARGDAGTGLFSTAFGLLVFFFFLFFALQLSVTMYTRTLAASAAQEGARRIAQRGGPSGSAVTDAEDGARQMLGGVYRSATFDRLDGDYVVFTVTATPPTFLASVGGGPWLGDVTRTARVRIEKPY